jgi:hypothetical protein
MRLPRIPAPTIVFSAFLAIAVGAQSGTAQIGIVAGPDAGNALLPVIFPPTVAVLEDGSFAIAGTTDLPSTDGYPQDGHAQFVVQTYSPDATPMGGLFMPQPVANPPADNGDIGSLGDRYFVSWQRLQLQTSRATMLSKDGRVIATPFSWPNSNIEFYASYQRYGHAPTWDFLPSFYYDAGTSPVTGDIFSQATVQAFSGAAKPIGRPATLASRPGWAFVDDLAINGDGTYVVVSQRCTADFSSCTEGVQVFAAGGEPLIPFSTVDIPSTFYGGLAAGVAPSGNFLLVWGTKTGGLSARAFDRRGRPLTGEVHIAQAPQGAAGFFRVQVRRRGSDFVLVWTLIEPDDSFDFYLSVVSSTVQYLVQPTLLAHSYDRSTPSGSNNISAAGYTFEMNDSGNGVLAWSTLDENYNFTGHLRLITVEGAGTSAPKPATAPAPPKRADPLAPPEGGKR